MQGGEKGGPLKRKKYILPFNEWQKLHKRARRAQKLDQSEVCGVILVGETQSIKLIFLKNHSKKSGSYILNLSDIEALNSAIARNHQRIYGSFHSHPITEAIPGKQDVEKGFYNDVELIYDVCGRIARLWKRSKRKNKWMIKELPLTILDQKKRSKNRD